MCFVCEMVCLLVLLWLVCFLCGLLVKGLFQLCFRECLILAVLRALRQDVDSVSWGWGTKAARWLVDMLVLMCAAWWLIGTCFFPVL